MAQNAVTACTCRAPMANHTVHVISSLANWLMQTAGVALGLKSLVNVVFRNERFEKVKALDLKSRAFLLSLL